MNKYGQTKSVTHLSHLISCSE